MKVDPQITAADMHASTSRVFELAAGKLRPLDRDQSSRPLFSHASRRAVDDRTAKGEYGFRGCIVNVSSVSAAAASVDRGDYCISKAGVAMATQLWAVRLAEFGIDVYEIRPGIIATDMTAGVKTKYDALIANGLTLEKRWGTPGDVGKSRRHPGPQ
ncbi:MAG TPA: SDR family oxidoreductase [Tepidisphaeraceae bacterium]|nr:SDR family oxidoreductase [Tepidisphaeraceae bacterium]